MKSEVTLQVDKGATIQGSSADTYDAPEDNPYDDHQAIDYGKPGAQDLPIDNASTWRRPANSWRTQGDVECYCGPGSNGSGYLLTDWAHVCARFTSAANWQQYAGPGGWNDLDSLEIGNGDQVGLTADQRRSHFTLWAMAGSPLLLGTDLTKLDSVAAKRIVNSGVKQVWSRKENSGDYVVTLFNTGTSGNSTVSVNWSQVGFTGSGDVTDLWSGSDKGAITNTYSATLRLGDPSDPGDIPGLKRQ